MSDTTGLYATPTDIPFKIYNKEPFTAKIISNELMVPPGPRADGELNDTNHIVIDLAGANPPLRYTAGQSIGVIPPGVDEKGKPYVVRLYSVASQGKGDASLNGRALPPGTTVSLCVKRDLTYNKETKEIIHRGVCSNYLCDIQPGDSVKVTGPWGKHFLLPIDIDRDFVFIATGTGVAPFRGMVRDLIDAGHKRNIHLFLGGKFSPDMLYDAEFNDLKKLHGGFHFHKAVSREMKNADGSRKYVQHLIADMKNELLPVLKDARTMLYICGLKGMEKGLYPLFWNLGTGLVGLPAGITADQVTPETKFAPTRGRVLVEVY